MPAGLLVLQRVPGVPGLRSPAESAAAAAALRHLRRPPPGNLPEAAVGPSATARGPSQPVSRWLQPRHWLFHTPPFHVCMENSLQTETRKVVELVFWVNSVWERLQVWSSYNQLIIRSLFVPAP